MNFWQQALPALGVLAGLGFKYLLDILGEGRRWRREDQRRYQEQKHETYVEAFSHLRELDKVSRDMDENRARLQQVKENRDKALDARAEIEHQVHATSENLAALEAATPTGSMELLAREQRSHALRAELTASMNSIEVVNQLLDSCEALLDRADDEERLIISTLEKLHSGIMGMEAVMHFLAPKAVVRAMITASKAGGKDSFVAAHAAFLDACRKDLGTA